MKSPSLVNLTHLGVADPREAIGLNIRGFGCLFRHWFLNGHTLLRRLHVRFDCFFARHAWIVSGSSDEDELFLPPAHASSIRICL